MFSAIFLAFFKLMLPVGLMAYLLIGWLRDSGKLVAFTNRKELGDQIKSYKKDGKEQKRKETNFALKKWFKFGGGFYGTAGLYTYAYIEIGEVLSFVIKMLDLDNWRFDIGIDLLINFIINSVKNFVYAIMWFSYWDLGDEKFIWLAFIAAYSGYAIGAKLANQHTVQGVGHVQLWQWWQEQRDKRLKTKVPAVNSPLPSADQDPQA